MGFVECVYDVTLELMNIWQLLLPETYQEMMMGSWNVHSTGDGQGGNTCLTLVLPGAAWFFSLHLITAFQIVKERLPK